MRGSSRLGEPRVNLTAKDVDQFFQTARREHRDSLLIQASSVRLARGQIRGAPTTGERGNDEWVVRKSAAQLALQQVVMLPFGGQPERVAHLPQHDRQREVF